MVRILGELLWSIIVVFLVGAFVGFGAYAIQYKGYYMLAAAFMCGLSGMTAWLIYRRWRGYFEGKRSRTL
jgi:hypothetical protein